MGAPSLKLRNPRFRVILGNPDDESSWNAIDVQTIGADFQRVESHMQTHKLGSMQDMPLTGTALAAYYALCRAGRFDGEFDAFESAYLEIQTVSEQTVTPTEPGHDPGSQ